MVTAVHTYSQAHAADIVMTFTEQANPDNEMKCLIAQFVQDFAMMSYRNAVTFFGWTVDAASPKGSNTPDAVGKASSLQFMVNDFVELLVNHEMQKQAMIRGIRFDSTPDENSSGRLRMANTPIYQVDICSFLGGGKANENSFRTSSMNSWLGVTFQALRGSASTYSDCC
jgi:hypothetical protein